MKLIGLTGGIGMGKSTSAKLLSERGLPIIDTDNLAHQLVEPGKPALEEIKKEFGVQVVDSKGQLRRDLLAQIVFADKAGLRRLEKILHPRIRENWKAEVQKWRTAGKAAGVVIIPLLFETDAQTEFDTVFCVACAAQSQHERLLERGWSELQIQQRLASQWPVEKKITLSNTVIWTDTNLEIHAAQLDLALQ